MTSHVSYLPSMAESSLRGVRAAAGSSSAEALLCRHWRPGSKMLSLLLISTCEHIIVVLYSSRYLAFGITPRIWVTRCAAGLPSGRAS